MDPSPVPRRSRKAIRSASMTPDTRGVLKMQFQCLLVLCVLLSPCYSFANNSADCVDSPFMMASGRTVIQANDGNKGFSAGKSCVHLLAASGTNEINHEGYASLISQLSDGRVEPHFRKLPLELVGYFYRSACRNGRSCVGDQASIQASNRTKEDRKQLQRTCSDVEKVLRSLNMFSSKEVVTPVCVDPTCAVATSKQDSTCHVSLDDRQKADKVYPIVEISSSSVQER